MSTSYLERYDAAPEAEKYALVYKWMWEEPLPFFKELRERRPIFVTPRATLITRFEDVTQVLSMPKVFTVQLYLPKMGDGIYLMSHDDDALHTREKSMMQSLLNRDDLPDVRRMVARLGKEILDNANGRIEIVYQYCRTVPALLVQEYFGLTGVDKTDLIEWSYWAQYNTFHNQPFDLVDDKQRKEIEDNHKRTSDKLGKYIAELMARRSIAVQLERANLLRTLWLKLKQLVRVLQGKTHEPLKDDIVTRLLRNNFPDAMDLDLKRLGVNAGGLLIGAIETTSQAVAQTIQYFLQSPALCERVKAAAQKDDPAEFDALVWEALRFVPISPYLFRKSVMDYTVGIGTSYATTIPAGTYVLPLTQSAMFDKRAFDNPDEFIPERNWYNYFHFGFGSHECLGRYVGMVMIPEMLRQIFRRKDIEASGAINFKGGPFPEEYWLNWR